MNWLSVISGFLAEAGMPLVMSLVLLDVIMGIAEAIKKGLFEWRRVAEFYRTMVIPYVLGYLALQAAFAYLPDGLDTILSPTLATLALGAITACLGSSILGHIKAIGLPTA